jgi:hypothetical protein
MLNPIWAKAMRFSPIYFTTEELFLRMEVGGNTPDYEGDRHDSG